MSCNGCRVLRKGCSEECMLRQSLQWIENPQAEGHATLFVAKFIGRATLMSFLSSVPPNQRSAMFRSLMYEAVGRSINPVDGAVGLLGTGNWHLCQIGVEKVLRGGALTPLPQFLDGFAFESQHPHQRSRSRMPKRGAPAAFNLQNFEAGSAETAATPSEESHTTTLASVAGDSASQPKLLRLFF